MTELLKITGEVTNSREISYDDLAGINASHQVIDVSKLGMKRGGDAITLGGLLELVQVQETAQYIGLHASADNFHASIPLAPIRDTALLIYRLHDAPLTGKSGGPFRFYIPNHAACHTDEIDECANVKFVDHIEFTADKGFDNRPTDDAAHEALHRHDSHD
ncbi:MAG: hypothetical protein CL681_11905 [Blastopirellula sp.]|nr:hypothetical protein [Blastopirellula sp.]